MIIHDVNEVAFNGISYEVTIGQTPGDEVTIFMGSDMVIEIIDDTTVEVHNLLD